MISFNFSLWMKPLGSVVQCSWTNPALDSHYVRKKNKAVSVNLVGLQRTQQDRKAVWVIVRSPLSGK